LVDGNAARGLRAVGITGHGSDSGEKADVVKAAADHQMSWPTYLDVTGAWTKAAGIRGEPVFVLLDREGKIAYRHAGKLTTDSAGFAAMKDLLAKM
jgi:hypothetical protein